ncbi:MAG: hypothetical protein ABL929_05240 [Ferruginibacter sp.]|nr:hypothetical protein [Ferruginibacter sp.]
MTQGLGRFEYFLIKLDELLLAASRTNNAALYLYENDCRTKVFMLQGLCKLYAGMHNEKRFLKLKERFKQLEDLLGAIDYYDSYLKPFIKEKKLPATAIKFITAKKNEKIAALNTLLLKRKWINHSPLRTKKIRKQLLKMSWQTPEKEAELIQVFYKKSIESINTFYTQTGDNFTDIETQLHELRRKLRWLSIYPQALLGCIQLTNSKIKDPKVAKYLIPEIVNSAFNKMPPKKNVEEIIIIEKNYFLALSYTIAALGKLKDNGLKYIITTEAIQATTKLTEAQALKKAYELHGLKTDALKTIMAKAKKLCVPFFEEKNLEKMIASF